MTIQTQPLKPVQQRPATAVVPQKRGQLIIPKRTKAPAPEPV